METYFRLDIMVHLAEQYRRKKERTQEGESLCFNPKEVFYRPKLYRRGQRRYTASNQANL